MNDVDHRNQAHGWVSGCAATQSICDGAATEENNIFFTSSSEVSSKVVSTAAECAAECDQHSDCIAWKWNSQSGQWCSAVRDATQRSPAEGWVSGCAATPIAGGTINVRKRRETGLVIPFIALFIFSHKGCTDTTKGRSPQKKNGKMWEFFPNGGPPLPPVWE